VLESIIPVGSAFLVLGRVVRVAVDTDTLTTERGRTLPQADRLDPMARLGRNEWATLGEIVTMQRPQSG
jgi:flavin reductase (DIM6/NTAB) family NADH-FMN oxidoreductase RutF